MSWCDGFLFAVDRQTFDHPATKKPPEGGNNIIHLSAYLERLSPVEIDQLVGLLAPLPTHHMPERYFLQAKFREHLPDLRVVVN